MFSQSMNTARSSVINRSFFFTYRERPGNPGFSSRLHIVSFSERYSSLRQSLFVELGLDPQEALLAVGVAGQIEGRDDGRRAILAAQPHGVLGRLLDDLAVFVGDEDARPPLAPGGVLAALELGVDDEVEVFASAGPELVEDAEEGESTVELGAALRQDQRRTLDDAVAELLVIQVVPPRSWSHSPRAPRVRPCRRSRPASVRRRHRPRPRLGWR